MSMMDKERWSWRFDFLATNVGFVACLDNLWRFPFLCSSHGGVLFLIPYLLCSMFLATPLLFLEMALGQYTSSGPIRAWKICPLFQGIGVATTVVAWWRNIYYNIILAWTLYYLYSSCIGGELPWARCNHEWNTASCFNYGTQWECINRTYVPIDTWDSPLDESPALSWSDWKRTKDQCDYNYPSTTNPAQEFWRIKVLGQTGTGGRGIVGHLALTLFLTWTLVYFGLWKGVKWSGKVAYFTVPFIHLIFIAFMIRGITLRGAYDGLIFYLKRDISKYKKTQVWIAAGTEVFYSFSIGLGAFTALGSFNKFHYNFYRDSIIAAFLNVVTSIYSGIIVFTFVGFEAYSERISVGGIVAGGYGSGRFFKVFPRSFAAMPVPRVWSIFFFLAVLMIGLNSQLVMVKAFITSVLDLFPPWLRIGYYKQFVLGVCVVNFLIGLSMVTQDGENVLWLFDAYGSGIFPLIWICFFESIAIGWCYGVRKFSFNIAEMLRWQQIEWYIICWTATVPIIAVLVGIGNIVSSSTLSLFSNPLGICMALSSMVCIPAGMVYAIFYQLIKGDGPTFTRLKRVIQPTIVPVLEEVHPGCMEMI